MLKLVQLKKKLGAPVLDLGCALQPGNSWLVSVVVTVIESLKISIGSCQIFEDGTNELATGHKVASSWAHNCQQKKSYHFYGTSLCQFCRH